MSEEQRKELELVWKSQITRQIIDLTKKCFESCVPNPNTKGLNKNDKVCFQNCVSNYLDSAAIISASLQSGPQTR
ncbi:hypothetical protein C9374_009439 [Naegleria lovaniensis]|uniref:Mitochondrial import inner membrane translocase subunit n=1 Tax=Naegleria lovaniensis TaxID=51637 RepID=A0AA88H4S5_NAELO|nr:uncharacterized protein C9374_009439 [Naegleria lovaniensis]KAG2392862.1 hypothetical protein C9374_009439 [Naegleria lovaniensis]